MKRETVSRASAEKIKAEAPQRQPGKWTTILAEVLKSGTCEKISGLTRGQCWGLKRAAKDKGVEATVIEKSTAVLLIPPTAVVKKV